MLFIVSCRMVLIISTTGLYTLPRM